MYYTFRIHVDSCSSLDFLSSFKAFVVKESDGCSREHYQGLIDSDLSIQTIRARVKKVNPNAIGNRGYSLSVLRKDVDTYLRYLCKGSSLDQEPDVVNNTLGYVFDVSQYHSSYWEAHDTPKADIVEHICQDYMGNYTVSEVTSLVIDYLLANGKAVNYRVVETLVIKVLLQKGNSSFRRNLKHRWAEKISLLIL